MERRNSSDGPPPPEDGCPHYGGEALPGEENRKQNAVPAATAQQHALYNTSATAAQPPVETANYSRTGDPRVNPTLAQPSPAPTEAIRRQVQALMFQGAPAAALPPDSLALASTSPAGLPASTTTPLQQRQALLDLLAQLVPQQSLAQSVVQLLQQQQPNGGGNALAGGHPAWTTQRPTHSPFMPSLGYSAMSSQPGLGNPGANSPWNPGLTTAPIYFPPPGAPLPYPAAAAGIHPTMYPPGTAAAASPWGPTTAGRPARLVMPASADPPPRAYKKRKYDHESFPEKLHRLLREAKEQDKDDIARFTDDGSQFQILNTHAFEEELLPRYFRHNRISSFKRLLRMYQFKRDEGTWMEGTFSHPLFHRDRPELCKQIRRIEQASPS